MCRLRYTGVLVTFTLFLCFPDSVFASNDVYRLLEDTHNFVEIETSIYETGNTCWASAGSRFVILSETDDSLVVKFTGGSLPETEEPPYKIVVEGVYYSISKAYLPEYFYELAFGFTYGLSVVPIKLMLTDGNFGGSASLCAYVGRKQDFFHWHFPTSIVAYMGFSLIPSSDSMEDSITVDTGLGFSVGLGVLLEPVDRIQVGISAGIDHANDPQIQEVYKYNHKWWIGLVVGYRLF